MLAFISLFLPAVLSVALIDHMRKEKLTVRGLVYCYAVANLFVNVVTIIIKMGLFQLAVSSQSFSSTMTLQMTVDYLIFAIPVAVLFSFVVMIVQNKGVLVIKSDNEENKEK